MAPIPVVTSDDHALHDPPYEVNAGEPVTPVYERPARVEAIRDALVAAGHDLRRATAHGDDPLLRAHDPDLVAFLASAHERWRDAGGPEVMIPDTFPIPRWARGGSPTPSPLGAPGWWCFDTATPVVAGSYRAARAAVDVALTAVDLVEQGARAAYALCRPPGHHAGRDYYGGFCLFNPAAVAATELSRFGRVAILDIDFHHGNGTQDVFWDDPDVLYLSLHGDPDHAYPFFSGREHEIGGSDAVGATLNIPLAPGTDAKAYLAALDVALATVAAFRARWVVVSVGFDTHAADPIATFALPTEAFGEIGARIDSLNLPTVLVQEGGYAVEVLGECARRFLAPFDDATGPV